MSALMQSKKYNLFEHDQIAAAVLLIKFGLSTVMLLSVTVWCNRSCNRSCNGLNWAAKTSHLKLANSFLICRPFKATCRMNCVFFSGSYAEYAGRRWLAIFSCVIRRSAIKALFWCVMFTYASGCYLAFGSSFYRTRQTAHPIRIFSSFTICTASPFGSDRVADKKPL